MSTDARRDCTQGVAERERILRVIEKMKYKPDPMARGLSQLKWQDTRPRRARRASLAVPA